MRLLFAKFGEIKCPKCEKVVVGGDSEKIIDQALAYINSSGTANVRIFSPVLNNIKGAHKSTINKLSQSNYKSIKIDTNEYSPAELSGLNLSAAIQHTIEIQVAEIDIKEKIDEKQKKFIEDSLRVSLNLAEGAVRVQVDQEIRTFSRQPYCDHCEIYFPQIQPRLFSFNSPYGACQKCQGLAKVRKVSPSKVVPNVRLTLAEGAIRPWARLAGQNGSLMRSLVEVANEMDFSLEVPIISLQKEALKTVMYGSDKFEGVIPNLEKKYRETDSDYLRQEIEQYMVESVCDECDGKRLNSFARSIYLFGKSICEMSEIEAKELSQLLRTQSKNLPEAAKQITTELVRRLSNLETVGLEYLTLSRSSETLSGGEAQRIRLGVQFDSFLSGVLYVLDEPTISLHSADTKKLINSFKKLKDEGNTLIVVEHDKAVIEESDYVFDIGPGAGKNGGEIIAQGTPDEIKKNPNSITGQYLSGKKSIPAPKNYREVKDQKIVVTGATHHNLKNINVEIPLGLFVCVCGVSGSGKSSLVYDIVAKSIAKKIHRSTELPGKFESIIGVENLDKIIKIDQSPIGRTPRSNLATYTGLFTPIRELFAKTNQAQIKNFQASQFSFNLKGGRCETCRGDGVIKIEMFFMPDAYVACEECGGKRYNSDTLEVRYRGKTIADILAMSVDDAKTFFEGETEIVEKVKVLQNVGLGYLPIGQSATTLSGGEAQRIKLASELSRPSTGKTIYVLDEPTTGLHFEDIKKLLSVLQELVNRGNTVLVIEHNLDVIKSADWIIEMGPGGGTAGGEIIATGSPKEVMKNKKSLTAPFLKNS